MIQGTKLVLLVQLIQLVLAKLDGQVQLLLLLHPEDEAVAQLLGQVFTLREFLVLR